MYTIHELAALAPAADPAGEDGRKLAALHGEWLRRHWPEGLYSPEMHLQMAQMYRPMNALPPTTTRQLTAAANFCAAPLRRCANKKRQGLPRGRPCLSLLKNLHLNL